MKESLAKNFVQNFVLPVVVTIRMLHMGAVPAAAPAVFMGAEGEERIKTAQCNRKFTPMQTGCGCFF